MRRAIVVAATAALLAGPAATFGHEQHRHPGKPTVGEVRTVAGDRLVLKTADGTVDVTLPDSTTFQRGDEPIGRGDLRIGDHATVFGTKLASGHLVAHEIHVEAGVAHP